MEDADRRRFVDNLQAELDGAALYRALAGIEAGSELATVYTHMAEAEERHADIWRAKVREAGVTAVPTQPGWRTRMLITLARHFGPGFILPTVTQRERADTSDIAINLRRAVSAWPPTSAPTPSSFRRLACGRRDYQEEQLRDLRAGIAQGAAMHCVRRSSAPMTGWSPTPVS
jgi:hypothetical protein